MGIKVFDLMVWDVKVSETDLLPPSQSFVALGTQFDLKDFFDGRVVVGNKPGRVDEVAKKLKTGFDTKRST